MKAKKALSAITLLVMLLSIIMVSVQAAGSNFKDVAEGAYYANAVNWAVEKNITGGTTATTFSPNDSCTKAHIITFLWRAYGSPEVELSNPFNDLNGSEYYYKSALWSYEKGMVSGNLFNGNEPCKRSDAVLFMWIASNKPTPSTKVNFTDISSTLHNVSAISWAVEQGITNGTSETTFSPETICTRAQIVTFLYRNFVDQQAVSGGSITSSGSQQQPGGVTGPTANSERPLTPEERAAATDAAAAQAKIAQETGNQFAGLKFDEEGGYYYYEYG